MLSIKNTTEQNSLIKRDLIIRIFDNQINILNQALEELKYKSVVMGKLDFISEDFFSNLLMSILKTFSIAKCP